MKQYVQNSDSIMFNESNLKTSDVLLMVLGFSIRFGLSYKARQALIHMIKTMAGPEFKDWTISEHLFSRAFNPPDKARQYHFFCDLCQRLLHSATKNELKNNETCICEKCETTHALSLNSSNYFISIDLHYQLQIVLNNEFLRQNIIQYKQNIKPNNKNIHDVHDGLLYKSLIEKIPENREILTCTFNTDGAPIFNNSKQSLWPIFIIINELPPNLRGKYPLLAGLLITTKEPNSKIMNLFMKSFVRQCEILGDSGIKWKNVAGESWNFIIKPLLSCVDSVARPVLQNRFQFNGYYGCSWCYSPGKFEENTMRYLLQENDPEIRTHTTYLKNMKEAMISNRTIKGVKGFSVLSNLPHFDMIWGFPVEYMHGVLLGVVKQLWKMLIDHKCPIHLTPRQQKEVNKRLLNITPPHEIHRSPRSLTGQKCKWKASEWRSWILFYCIPCLTGILDDQAVQHIALLSKTIFILLQTSISEAELSECEYNMLKFVGLFQVMYGDKYVTFNVHSLLHLVQSIRFSGPLWTTSTFPFENGNYILKQQIHSPKGLYEQISNRFIQRNNFLSMVEEISSSNTCTDYCQSIFLKNRTEKFCRSMDNKAVFLGTGVYDDDCIRYAKDDQSARTFDRCIYNNIIFHGTGYEQPKKTNNTVIITRQKKFAQILKFLYTNTASYAKVIYLQVENIPEIPGLHIMELFKKTNIELLNIKDILEKCILIDVKCKTYISRLPNTIEIQ
ncbi:PREDICTED: uncharacterized protein LOC105448453 [Wasmannia auropunctata]|uniref:uncharacterized protein LOC105448453 n=1 Tax=Wasmannia auropunctata TaxID=64793 RepID=UPI0005EFCE59|nr:PREDICTED: uncharacterized protein LOC105448453 [Wasmannia auropunctata]